MSSLPSLRLAAPFRLPAARPPVLPSPLPEPVVSVVGCPCCGRGFSPDSDCGRGFQPRFGLWEGLSAPTGAGFGLAGQDGRTGKRGAKSQHRPENSEHTITVPGSLVRSPFEGPDEFLPMRACLRYH